MAPWTTLTEFFERLTNHEARAGNLREDEMRLAAAALLVHAAVIDGEVAGGRAAEAEDPIAGALRAWR